MRSLPDALDLFAGAGGWSVACQRIGILEGGVDNMRAARATRDAAGFVTLYDDVWDGLLGDEWIGLGWPMQIASAPCQTFSAAGAGAGRAALDRVLRLVDERAYERPADLRAFGDETDPRTALVLTPLAHVWRDRPEFVAWEQVPPVLPVWERAAVEMRVMGYSVWTGILNAEQYGVPQTRRRPFLIARRDGGEARPPVPTHSRYYPRDPKRLDPDVLPWVSMAQALGWGLDERPSPTVTGGGTETGGAEPIAHLERYADRADWVMRSNYGTSGDPAARGERVANQPAPTMTSKAGRNHWLPYFSGASGTSTVQRPRAVEHPAHTVTGAGIAEWHDSPDPMLRNGMRPEQTRRVTPEEAAVLQSFPAGFPFRGGKGARFLQIGNAVPPLLAEAVLRAVLT